jgi:protein phosphatase
MNMRRPGSDIPKISENNFFQGEGKAETLKSREKGFLIGVATKSAESHPEHNEDRYTASVDTIAVYDGMGGSEQGEKGAILAKSEIESRLLKLPEQKTPEALAAALASIIKEASVSIYKKTEIKDGRHTGLAEMGSTVSLLKVWAGEKGEKKVVVANVGDSRIYRLRKGELTQLTEDDGAPDMILNSAIIGETVDQKGKEKIAELFRNFENEQDLSILSDDEKMVFWDMFKNRNGITQALGKEQIMPKTFIYELQPGDEFFAMSDGIHDPFSDKKIQQSLAQNPERSLTRKAQDLVAAVESVNKLGTKRSKYDRNKYDDKTVVGLKYEGKKEPAEEIMELDPELAEIIEEGSYEDNTIYDLSVSDLLDVKEIPTSKGAPSDKKKKAA